jgi:hypothetical protein
MSTNPPKKPSATATNEPQDLGLEDQIRLRAYELYEARGREDGHELEDWYRAIEELTIKKFRTATACLVHTSKQKNDPRPDLRGLFHTTHHFNRRFESGGVTSGTWLSQTLRVNAAIPTGAVRCRPLELSLLLSKCGSASCDSRSNLMFCR